MKYWVGIHRNTGDANKDMFDYRSYYIDADNEEEATEKGRALALADDPEHTELKIYTHMDHEEEFTWRHKVYNLLDEATNLITEHEYIGAVIKIYDAIEIAHLDEIEKEGVTNLSIESFRRIAQKTQREVADKVGITINNYARLERGEADVRKMSLENAMKICEILRITPYELMNAGDNSRKAYLDKSENK